MLGLKLVTDPKWVNIVESNIEEILTDHAWCEQKAATNIITIITYNSEHEELVPRFAGNRQRRNRAFPVGSQHHQGAWTQIGKRTKRPLRERTFQIHKKDGSRNDAFVDRLLFSAMIEARKLRAIQGLVPKY